jgi:hypothetical protein
MGNLVASKDVSRNLSGFSGAEKNKNDHQRIPKDVEIGEPLPFSNEELFEPDGEKCRKTTLQKFIDYILDKKLFKKNCCWLFTTINGRTILINVKALLFFAKNELPDAIA